MTFTNDSNSWGWTPERELEFSPLGAAGFLPGRIIAQNHHTYTLASPQGLADARIAGAFEYRCAGPEDYPLLGDWVAFTPVDNGPSQIQKILKRNSLLRRLAPGGNAQVQPLAANLDLVLIVMALDQDYSPSRAERYFTLARDAGVQILLWLNKADLYPQRAEEALAQLSSRWPEVKVLSGSALDRSAVLQLSPWIGLGKTVCLLGSSGAGKSTLLNGLLGREVRTTGAVRTSDGKGRHTSSDRVLIPLESGALIMDHPGLREVGLWTRDSAVGDVFSKITTLADDCRFKDCTHEGEPGCRVQKARESGEIDEGLWISYQRQTQELAYLARRTDPGLMKEERDKWKAISKFSKAIKKQRER